MMNPTDNNDKACLFALLEPTPIDERLVSQRNMFQHHHHHHNLQQQQQQQQRPSSQSDSSSLALLSAFLSNNLDTTEHGNMVGDNCDKMIMSRFTAPSSSSPLSSSSTSAVRLQTEEADLDVFCGEDYLKDFDMNDADCQSLIPFSSDDDGSHSAPTVNDFLSAPWFQDLDNNDISDFSAAGGQSNGNNNSVAGPLCLKAPPSSGIMSPPPQFLQPQPEEKSLSTIMNAGYASSNTVYSTEPSIMHSPPAAMSSFVQQSFMMMAALVEEPSFPSSSSSTNSVFSAEENVNNDNDHVPNISDSQCRRWTERYNELVEFKNKHGHCGIPSQWPTNTSLAQWVKRQRYQYKLRNEQRSDRPSTLTDDRIQALEDLGFVWDSHAAFWEERWNELQQFRELNGHTHVPTKYQENPQLGIWCKCQRRQFKIFQTEGPAKSYLTLERIAKLMEIGFVFDPRANSKRRTKKSRATAVSSS